jgi:DNA-binding transcriptional LysR family regulator
MREADVAIRMSPPRQPDLIQRQLLTVHNHDLCLAEYMQEHGTPQSTEDLEQHRLIVYGDVPANAPVPSEVNWLLDRRQFRRGTARTGLRVNNIYGILRAVQSGVGIGALPDYGAGRARKLDPHPAELAGPPVDFLLRLSGRTAPLQAHRRVPRLSRRKGRRDAILGSAA